MNPVTEDLHSSFPLLDEPSVEDSGGEPDHPQDLPARNSPRRFSPRTRDTIANQLVGGTPYSEIAALHNCDPSQISNLAKSQDMKDRVERRRQQLLEAGSQIMFKWLLHADRLADDQLNTALTPGPDQYRARTWILERVSPSRSVTQQQVEVNHHVQHEVMVGLRDAIKEVNASIPSGQLPDLRHAQLLDGKTALPPVDVGMDDEP